MVYIRSVIVLLIIALIIGSYSVGYKLGKTKTNERVITIFTNISNIYTNVDYGVSNTGDPFYDFFVQLTNQ